MNVMSLIQLVKIRPESFVGARNLELIYHFINGFLFNNIRTNRVDSIDKAFKRDFNEWVKNQLEQKLNIKFDLSLNYLLYINETFPDEEQRLKIFFEMCDEFFIEISKDNV